MKTLWLSKIWLTALTYFVRITSVKLVVSTFASSRDMSNPRYDIITPTNSDSNLHELEKSWNDTENSWRCSITEMSTDLQADFSDSDQIWIGFRCQIFEILDLYLAWLLFKNRIRIRPGFRQFAEDRTRRLNEGWIWIDPHYKTGYLKVYTTRKSL